MWIGCSDSRVPITRSPASSQAVFAPQPHNIVVHSVLNALSADSIRQDRAAGEGHRDVAVVGGCSGVQAALEGARQWLTIGFATFRTCATAPPQAARKPASGGSGASCHDLNVVERVINVCVSTVTWTLGRVARRSLFVTGAFGVHD
jgi:carbonic anhydrase